MKYQFVTAHYNSDGTISVYGRDENYKKQKIVVRGFRPYFYVPMNSVVPDDSAFIGTQIGFQSIYGEWLWKIIMRDPTDVKRFRSRFTRTFEADIRFTRRFLIDVGVRSGFEVGSDDVAFSAFRPVDFVQLPLVSFFDIEVQNESGRFSDPKYAKHPIVAFTVYDTVYKTYLTVLLDDRKPEGVEVLSEDHKLIRVHSEEALLWRLHTYFTKLSPDVVTGWNVDFDIDYSVNRLKKFGIDNPFRGSCIFDMLKGYRKVAKKSGRLKDVVIEEGITDTVVASEYHKGFYNENRDLFVIYNRDDVRYCVEIDKKYKGLVQYFWDVKNFAGLESMSKVYYFSVLIDTYYLRKCSGKFVLPSKPELSDEEEHRGAGFKGAIVFEPKDGIYDGVAVIDMSKYYPSIIVSYNLTPEKTKKLGTLPQVCLELEKERLKYDEMISKTTPGTDEYENLRRRRQVVKDHLNAVWGYIGSKSQRLYNKEIAETITRIAREGLILCRNRLSETSSGNIIYGDTDGLMLLALLSSIESIVDDLNNLLSEYHIKQGVTPPIRIKLKFEKYCARVLFAEAKSGGRGAKKRYAMRIVLEDGKEVDYVFIRGFESVRGNTARITRKMLPTVLKMVLYGKDSKEVVDYIRNIVSDMRSGKYSITDVAISVTLGKRLPDYTKTKPDFVRGSLFAVKYLKLEITGGDMVKMVYVRGLSSDVLCFLDENDIKNLKFKVNYDKMVGRTVRMPTEKILKLIGRSWEEVLGTKTLTEVFGEIQEKREEVVICK